MSISPAQITIRPETEPYSARFPSSSRRLAGERYAFPAAQNEGKLFGEDGFGTEDVVDAVNPLRHIPVISTLYENLTGSKASAASKIVGGTLLGGPVGFLASMADVVFEQATGESAGNAVYAALVGEEKAAATQLAQAASPTPLAAATAPATSPEPTDTMTQAQVAAAVQQTQRNLSVAMNQLGSNEEVDAATLALFGRNIPSAHASYRKAQFKPYLKDVSTSLVM